MMRTCNILDVRLRGKVANRAAGDEATECCGWRIYLREIFNIKTFNMNGAVLYEQSETDSNLEKLYFCWHFLFCCLCNDFN